MDLLSPAGGFPAFASLKQIGYTVLSFGVLVQLVIQFYRHVTGQSAEFVTPLAKGVLGFALLGASERIGDAIYGAGMSLSESIAGDAQLAGLNAGVTKAFDALNADFGLTDLVSLKFWISLISLMFVLAAFVAKFAVIDVIFPVYFMLVVMMGGIAISLSFLPGVETARGWLLSLIEVSLWPVIFQVVVAMMASTIGSAIDISQALDTAVESGGYGPLIQSLAVLFTLVFMCLATPVLAARLARGQTAADMLSRASIAAGFAAGAVGAGLLNAGGRMGGRLGGAVQSQLRSKSGGGSSTGENLNRRFYNPPGWKADEARQYNALRKENPEAADGLKNEIQARVDARKRGAAT